jgi:hypothetical protein
LIAVTELPMVLFVLIRVFHREFADRVVVEVAAGAHVAGDRGIAGAGMLPRQYPGAQPVEPFDHRADLGVARLANVEVSATRPSGPPQNISLADCISRWPATTRCPWFLCTLLLA